VHDGEDWGTIAAQYGMEAWKLIDLNFSTHDPSEVNYYLRTSVGCNRATRDNKNWIFSDSAIPGYIYVPARAPTPPNFGLQSGSVRFNVPHIKGAKHESCWHDSARMIYQYKRKADLNPLPAQYAVANKEGLNKGRFITLAREVGMRGLVAPPLTYTPQWLADALTRYGPLWAAGDWNNAGGHIIVITGVDSTGAVYVNDPAFDAPLVKDIKWFNQHLCRADEVENSLMYLP
jgi:hypothetical protein